MEFAPGMMPAFADLIAPTSTEEFFADYWEKTFLHILQPPGRFDGCFSLRDIDRWTHSTRSGVVFVLLPAGDEVRLEVHQADALAPGAVLGNFSRGHAQILKKLADWPSLQGLVHHLGKVFHASIDVNAFLTPAGARTYPTYTANNDILVLQLEGVEAWRLHEFSVLQLDLSQKKHLEFPGEWHRRTESPVLAEVRLRPGDVLFIPRGMPHSATSPEGTGLHLRIYITPLFWMDFLKFAAEHAAVRSQALQRSLPPGFVESQPISDRMRSTFHEVMEEFRKVSFDEVLAAVKRNRVAHQGFPPVAHFDALAGAEALTVDSEVERRPDVLCTVAEVLDAAGNRRSSLYFGEEQVSGPPHLRQALEFVRDRSRFRVSEIPGLDEKGQVVLARRLVVEGLLRPAAAAEERVEGSLAALR